MITIYTDGSADNRKEVREGGLGIVLLFTDKNGKTHQAEHFEGKFINTTSARMEIIAVIRALQLVDATRKYKITMFVDNQYVVNSVMKGWVFNWINHGHEKANMDLWQLFVKEFDRHGGLQYVELRWIKGHAGFEHNERADFLASQGRKQLQGKNDTDTILQAK